MRTARNLSGRIANVTARPIAGFGGDDLRTLLVTAITSVYTSRVKTPGQPHPWYRMHKGG